MFWPPCCRPSSSLSASWSRELTAHSERYSLTARTETAGLIRQLHPSQQREGTQVLDRVQHRTERRSGPHLVQMVEEKIPLNLILNPEEREAALGKIILKKTKSTCLHEAGPQTWPPQRHNIYWFTLMSFWCRARFLKTSPWPGSKRNLKLHQPTLDSSSCYPSVLTDQSTAGFVIMRASSGFLFGPCFWQIPSTDHQRHWDGVWWC